MAKGFRIAGTLNEFLKDLEVLKDEEHSLIVWQNDAEGNKQIFDGHYDSYSKDKERIIINVKLKKNEVFEKDNPVYIFEKAKGILFKGRYEFCVNAVLKILADDKVFLKEKRHEKRFYFNYTEVKAKILATHLDSEDTFEEKLKLRDVCSGGFSFKVSHKKAKLFTPGMKISLIDIGGIDLPRVVNGKIAHISHFKSLSTNAEAITKEKLVGVSFDTRSKLFEKVISVIRQMS